MTLKIKGITKRFGGMVALSDVEFDLVEGEITGLIGPNGAGKTTLFNCVSGLLRLDGGEIEYDNEIISNKLPHEIAKMGIGRTFQIVKPFGNMTALQNVMVGGFNKETNFCQVEEIAMNSLKTVNLDHKSSVVAKDLNLSERKKLEIAKAYATEPKLLLLDEVMAGLTIPEVQEMIEVIKNINKSGVTILIIEHIMEAIMKMSDEIVVLNFGKKIATGSPEEIRNNEDVIEAYFGVEEEV